ncbi:MAG TPA: metallophosphoesterase family protein [Terriglobales bacterium]|nr:metallophosphoesterase family protein [Terriglobales bacterium]
MRILLLSDIHSNLEALDACLAGAPAYDQIVNLGDIVGYGASPNEVTAKVRALGGSFVRGNHDRVVAGLDDVETFNPIAGLAALWNRSQLTSEHLEWLRDLPKGPVVLPAVPGVQFVHGAPGDEDRYVVSIEDSLPTLAESVAGATFFGHTHIQNVFSLRGGFAENIHPEYPSIGNRESWEVRLESGSSYMINPGSVGQPRDGDWRAAFALFDSDTRVVTFWRVPYDVRTAQEKILAANLPARLATRLAAGR